MFSGISPGGAVTITREYSSATGDYTIPVSVTDPKLNFAVDSGLDNQYTDQVSVGIERQIAGSAGVAVSFVYKNEGGFIRLRDNRGVYAPRVIVDTFDGRSQEITVQTLTSGVGSQLFTVVDREDLDQEFKSVVVEFNKRFSNNVQMQSSYTWQDSKAFGAAAGDGQHPAGLQQSVADRRLRPGSERHHQRVRPDRDQRAPCGQALGHLRGPLGHPAGRALLLRGGAPVRAPDHRSQHGRGSGRRDHPGRARVARTSCRRSTTSSFAWTRTSGSRGQQRLRFSVDFFNIFNSDTVLTLRNNSSQVTATTPWQQTLSVVRPRTVQLGVRYEF